MNMMKVSGFIVTLSYLCMSLAHAEELSSLPTITVMAESELREEVGSIPFQEDQDVRQALQQKIIKSEQDIQNYKIGENIGVIDIQPKPTAPDMSKVSPLLQEYVMAVANGLQSSDPTTGLFKMLEPVGVDRNAALQGIKDGSIKLNIDSNMLKLIEGNWLKP